MRVMTVLVLCVVCAGMSNAAGAQGRQCDPANNRSQQVRLLDCLYAHARKHYRQRGAPEALAGIIYELCHKERRVMYDAIRKDCGWWKARHIRQGYDEANRQTAARQIIRSRGR